MITLLSIGISISLMKQHVIITQRYTSKKDREREKKQDEPLIDESVSVLHFYGNLRISNSFVGGNILTEGAFVSQLYSNGRI